MKHIQYSQRLFIIVILFFFSCENFTSKNSTSVDEKEIVQLVNDWNVAYNSKNIIQLINFYDSTIFLYGVNTDKNGCIEDKLSFFKKHPDYYQQIFGNIEFQKISDKEIKCTFIKRATINQQTKDYPSYLNFIKKESEWKIKIEGDLVTDKNLAKKKEINIPKDAVKGDFNGDGLYEYMWLTIPKIDSDGMSCISECTSYINFSDTKLPSIKVESCIGGNPKNLGDLNNDKSDEIGLLPSWFTSCWRDYSVWTLKNNQWTYAVNPFPTHCNQWEQDVNPIEIDNNNKGHVIIRYSEHSEEDIITKTKSIPIR